MRLKSVNKGVKRKKWDRKTFRYAEASRVAGEKTGPEAGQYFHVCPPIGFIWMGYKTQEE